MDAEKKTIFSASFLGEPAYKWMGFAVVATVFLWLWGRVLNFLTSEIEV